MQTNVLEYLEKTAARVPNKIAFANETKGLCFLELYQNARAIGTAIFQKGHYKEPIIIFMKKHPDTAAAFFGTIYGGNYYVPIDEEMPRQRIELIFQNLHPKAMICDQDTKEMVKDFSSYEGAVYLYEDFIKQPIREDILKEIRRKALDIDPIYIVFTSGSTGIPKGVAACHKSVLDYIEQLSEVLEFGEDTIFGNQTPLYFDACLKELYPTIKFGATTYFIPKSLFMFPMKLVDFLNEHKINTVCWVVSALTMISSFGVLDKKIPKYLKTIAFGSEIFPIKQFKLWKKTLPEALFVNLYGPTEATGMSCYYRVEREFELGQVIPIGQPFCNTQILLLNEKKEEVKLGEIGEIYIRGTAVTLGYYNDFERTKEVFVQNPLNTSYPEIIYRTGDLGTYNERGELIFVSRRDYQIKHMGHRIELGEIEANVNQIEEVKMACCIYDKEKEKIVLYYVGDITSSEIAIILKKMLPRYMLPNSIEVLQQMPLTANGKIDRVFLKEKYKNKRIQKKNKK